MTEAQEKLYVGLKALEKETGFTIIGAFSHRLYIVPVGEARPYGDKAFPVFNSPAGISKEEGGN